MKERQIKNKKGQETKCSKKKYEAHVLRERGGGTEREREEEKERDEGREGKSESGRGKEREAQT